MATSLAEQLQRLKVPQTLAIVDSKKRASILFDRHEAATKDRKTIFELGQIGITELIGLNPEFTQFEQTLFDSNTIELERSVEDAKVNVLLNKAIKKFFYHLSPYFMLQPAHLCLEWLIRRFHIHQFNRDEFIDLILPYHETKIFIKCLQTMNFKHSGHKWDWLEPSRKAGVCLSKTALQNRAYDDTAFLKFICKSTVDAIKELDNRSNTLQTKINFYCITVIGALERAPKITESHISSILRSLLKGFASNSVDFTASSFMITAQLVSKANLKHEILEALILKLCQVKHKSLQSDIILLLILIYQAQSQIIEFPGNLLINFISKKALLKNLNELSSRMFKISTLCVPLLRACFHKIHSKDSEWIKCQEFLANLFDEVHFQDYEVKNIIRAILENNQTPKRQSFDEDEIVELDSDDETELLQEDIQKMYSGFLHQLEKQYPLAFDLVVKETMQNQNNVSDKRKQALKSILAFRLKSSYSEDSTSIYENLYHPNYINRTVAIKYVADNFDALTTSVDGKAMIKDSLLDRLGEDDHRVLVEVLKISSHRFSKIMDNKIFIGKLIEILHKCYTQNDDWSAVKKHAIEHMTSLEMIKVSDPNTILLTLLPLLISDNQADIHLLKRIAKKEFTQFIPFMSEYFASNAKISGAIKMSDFEDTIQKIQSFPEPESILNSIKNVQEKFYSNSVNSSFVLLFLGNSFLKFSGTDVQNKFNGFKIFEIVKRRLKFVYQPDQLMHNIKPNEISLTIILNYLLALTKEVKINVQHFVDTTESAKLFKNVFEYLITKSSSTRDEIMKQEYSICLKNLLQQTFNSMTEKLQYLSYYFTLDRINEHNTDYALQIRVIKLFNRFLTAVTKSDLTIDRSTLLKVILGLSSTESIIREITMETLHNLAEFNSMLDKSDRFIVSQILKSNQEILMDEIQITIVLFSLICPKKGSKSKEDVIAQDLLDSILRTLKEHKTEIYLKVVLLKVIKLVNNEVILENLIDLGLTVLKEAKSRTANNQIGFDFYNAEIYRAIADRFDSETITILIKNKYACNFIENSLKNHDILINCNGKLQSVAAIILNNFDEEIYCNMPAMYKESFLKNVFESMSTAEENSVSVAGSKLIKRLQIDGNDIKTVLIEMKELCSNGNNNDVNKSKATSKSRRTSLSNVNSLTNAKWKMGITLLELLQNMKNVDNFDVLIPILFELLKKCLEFEEQVPLDYTKQLILSSLINLCKKLEDLDKKSCSKLKENTLKMDLVVECIRSTQNPQTHHHALMLLSQCAYLVPQQILHNITNVFTFMGSSVVRYDDSFSFQIIFNLIESVIPMLIEASTDEEGQMTDEFRDKKVIPILKVFSDIILDVPEHRRLLLYTKLVRILNAEKYLWMFLCILFESHVVNTEKEKLSKSKSSRRQNASRSASPEEFPKRISIALQLSKEFEPTILIETFIALFKHLKKLPQQKPGESNEMVIDVAELETSLFEVSTHSAKQLRHYKFSILQFMSVLTSSAEFVNSIAKINKKDEKTMKSYYKNFIINILSFIPYVTLAVDKNSETNQQKFWKIILHHCTEVLDNAISLLTPDLLLIVVHGLMQHDIPVVRKKVTELLIDKLQYKSDYFDNCNYENMLMLLTPLKSTIKSVLENDATTNEDVNFQHLALIAIKLLSRILALRQVDEFKEILNLLSRILKNKASTPKIIMAAAVLAISEISSNLRAHSISLLHKFMPHLIEVLNDQAEEIVQQAPDNISVAILVGIHRLFDSLSLFLGPYYVDIFTLIIKIWVRLDSQVSDNRTAAMYNKLHAIWTKISTSIPLRLLTPHCEEVYAKLVEEKNNKGVTYLMKLLSESFSAATSADVNVLQADLTKFFLVVLDMRSNLNDNNQAFEEINEIEGNVLQTFVSLILKLSETSFRPLYQKLYDWAIRNPSNDNKENHLDRAITYFALSGKIAEALKSLFVLFASDFIQDAANLLVQCNHKAKDSSDDVAEMQEKTFPNAAKCVILLENILNTLYNIFLYDTQGFMNTHRFDILMQPITNQIENPLVISSPQLKTVLLNCISQLTVVVSNDVLWKQLNYEILLRSRNSQSEVKILAVDTCVEMAKKLGEDFSSLLPETIPFMAELLEDENPLVEKATRKAVQELEKVVGESLQKYF